MYRFVMIALCLCSICVGCGTAQNAQSSTTAEATAPALASAISCPDAPGPITGPIIFGKGNDLASMQEDGTSITQVTSVPEGLWARDAAWSPDGKTLAFSMSHPPSDEAFFWVQVTVICGIDRATGKGRVLAESGQDLISFTEPNWAPDGQSLLVSLTEYQTDAAKQFLGATDRDRALSIGIREF